MQGPQAGCDGVHMVDVVQLYVNELVKHKALAFDAINSHLLMWCRHT